MSHLFESFYYISTIHFSNDKLTEKIKSQSSIEELWLITHIIEEYFRVFSSDGPLVYYEAFLMIESIFDAFLSGQ